MVRRVGGCAIHCLFIVLCWRAVLGLSAFEFLCVCVCVCVCVLVCACAFVRVLFSVCPCLRRCARELCSGCVLLILVQSDPGRTRTCNLWF